MEPDSNIDDEEIPSDEIHLEEVGHELREKDKRSLVPTIYRNSNRKYSLVFLLFLFSLLLIYIPYFYIKSQSNSAEELENYNTSLYARDVLHNYWLIGTITAYHNQDRRDIIRNSWQKLYRRYNATFKFIICNPSVEYASIIEAENKTYGDLIVLSHLEENFQNAATIKPMEFFKHIKNNYQPFTYVSRLDDDAFLNVPAFWDEYLKPNLADPKRIIIARDTYPLKMRYSFPGGQFYTLSWDLMCLLIRLHEKNPITTENDDFIFAHVFNDARERYKQIDLFCYKAFDYNPYVNDVNRWEHMVTESAINPHKMKTREAYLEVASMFDENGVNVTAVREVNSRYEHDNSKGWQVSCTQNITFRMYN